MPWLQRVTILFLAIIASLPALAHEGHGDEKKEAAKPKNYFSSEAISEKYELFLKYSPLKPGEDVLLTLFVSDYNTNAPIDSATFEITSPEDENLKFEITQTGPGTYSISTNFPEAKVYTFTVNINSKNGSDLLLLEGIEPGKELVIAEELAAAPWYTSTFFMLGLGLAAGILITFLLMKARERRMNPAAVILALIILSIPLNNINVSAHEGHNEAAKGGNTFSNAFDIPKETQFLFEIQTEKIEPHDFVESVKLFGTVIPSSKGQATVQSPQTAKIMSLNVNVGQHVKRGQIMATIEPVLDAGSVVNFLAEHNNVQAEIEAARKEYERLKAIEDIAAKRDVVESEARYQRAKQNKELYDKLTSGQSDALRTVTMRSPIDGVVGNFTFAIGATVNANEPVFTVYDLSKVFVEAQVFDQDVMMVNNGEKFLAASTTDENKKLEVKLLAPAQTINPTNQSQRVIFEMNNPKGIFKIGEFVNLRAFGSRANKQLSVPSSAIKEINGKPVIFVKDNAQEYSVSYITTGMDDGSRTVVLKGLEEGERIVAKATYQVKMIYLNQ